jgi:hypothetical protein
VPDLVKRNEVRHLPSHRWDSDVQCAGTASAPLEGTPGPATSLAHDPVHRAQLGDVTVESFRMHRPGHHQTLVADPVAAVEADSMS